VNRCDGGRFLDFAGQRHPLGSTTPRHDGTVAGRPNPLASARAGGYVSARGLEISRSTEGSWSFRGPFAFPCLGRPRKFGQSADLGPDDLEGAAGLVRTQVRQRDGPRRQVRELQADGVRRLRHEHRLELEQAEIPPATAGAAVVRGDPTKLQLEFSVLLPAAALEDDMDRPAVLALHAQHDVQPLHAEVKCDAVGVPGVGISRAQPELVKDSGENRHGGCFGRAVEIAMEPIPQ